MESASIGSGAFMQWMSHNGMNPQGRLETKIQSI